MRRARRRLIAGVTTGVVVRPGIIGATKLPRNTNSRFESKTRRGAWRLPSLVDYYVVAKARKRHASVSNDSHRKSGALSFGAALSPVESYFLSLRSSMSSRPVCTPWNHRVQEKIWRIGKFACSLRFAKEALLIL